MAIEHVSAVLHGLFGVDPSEKLVMFILAEHARRGSALVWPSMATISRLSCLTDRQVQRILRKLISDGWLELEKFSKGGRGRLNTNIYRLNMERLLITSAKGDTHTTLKGDTHTTLNGDKGDTHVTLKGDMKGVQGCHGRQSRVTPMSPKPVLTGIKEPVLSEPEPVSANPPVGDLSDERSTPFNKSNSNSEPELPDPTKQADYGDDRNPLQARIQALANHFTEKTK